jgi:hypothetical protein
MVVPVARGKAPHSQGGLPTPWPETHSSAVGLADVSGSQTPEFPGLQLQLDEIWAG